MTIYKLTLEIIGNHREVYGYYATKELANKAYKKFEAEHPELLVYRNIEPIEVIEEV